MIHARGRATAAVMATMMLAGCAAASATAPATTSESDGSVPDVGPGSDAPRAAPVRAGPTDSDATVRFQVVLRMPGRAALDRYLSAVGDRTSPEYRRFLRPDEFGLRFGLGDDAVETVANWLEQGGLRVVGRDLGRAFLAVEGSALDVNRAFAITLIDWLGPKQLRYHTPEGTPRIAPEVADSVIGIAGLDTSPRIRPMFVPPISDVPVGGMRPADVALAYDIKPLHDAGINGEGQTIAIVSFDTFLDSDVAAFDAFVGIAAPSVERRPAPAGYQPVLGDGSGEVNLDIDIIRAIAPAATIIDYEADPTTDFAEVFAAILDDARANVVSVSWGGCEIDWPPILRVLTDSILERAFAQGVNIFTSSGDTGAFSCAHQRDANDDRVSALYPSTSPYVISVGGTFLWVREDGSYLKEAAWEEAFRKIGSGGGPSDTYARPDWQVGNGIAGGTQRLTPDVAGPADGESGMIVVSTPIGGSAPDIGPAGGTSAAAPFWSASMLLAQQLAEREGVGLGQLAPMLYALAATAAVPPLFHDVTLGGNLSEPATTGWDAATGLGSPDVTALANAIVLRLRAGE